jgi:hypothetical protein
MDEPGELVMMVVQCATPDCCNDGVPIVFEAPAGSVYVCGPCGQPILSVEEPPDPEPPVED